MTAASNKSMDVRQKQRHCFLRQLACVFAHVISAVRCFLVNLKMAQMLKTKLFYASTFIFALLLLTLDARSQIAELKLSAEGQRAYETLLVAKQFEDKALGVAAESSKLVEAYNAILKEPTADAAFKSLLEKATLPGQLYALCGLWFTDNAFFRTAVENYRRSDKWVGTQFGCIIGGSPVASLIETKNSAIIDINRPKESLDEYFAADSKAYADWNNRKKKKKTDVPPESHGIDILNGGYPVYLRDYKSF